MRALFGVLWRVMILFLAGVLIGMAITIFAMSLTMAAKRGDEYVRTYTAYNKDSD